MRSFLHRARSLSERASAPVVHLIPVSARTQVRTRLCTLTSPSRGTTCPLQATARIAPRFRRSDGPFSASRRPAPHGRAPLRPVTLDAGGRHADLVVPPLTGGLRCGLLTQAGWGGPYPSRPAPHGRAPLRDKTRAVLPGLPVRVVPPLTGGLRCGPPVRRGPPQPSRSSRPSRAGSVAAGTWPGWRRRCRQSSRPSRAGSVAATSPPAAARCCPRRPAPHGRAPLRRGRPRRPPAGRPASSRPSRAGSVAASRAGWSPPPGRPVVPPLTGGLRCGTDYGPAVGPANPGRPAPHGRAPLRPLVFRAGGARGEVVPPLTGGLRCGGIAQALGHGTAESSRPSRAGSVAAPMSARRPASSG